MTGWNWKSLLVAVMVVAMAGTVLYVAPAAHKIAATQSDPSKLPVSTMSLPLFFEANEGQTDSHVKFLARGAGFGLFLTPDEAVLQLQPVAETRLAASPLHHEPSANHVIRMRLVGANTAPRVSGAQPLPGKSNYFIGNDPRKWRRNVSQFARVEYQSVYPGVDLAYYGHQGELEYDFRVAPGADPSRIAMSFEGASARLDSGDLVLSTGQGDVRFHAPRLYQPDGNNEKPVTGRFLQLAENRIGFEVGPYDRSRELVIDPTLSYSTYLGGSQFESAPFVAVGSDLNIYVAGSTNSPDFPLSTTPPPIQSNLKGAQNIFIARINPSAPTPAQQLVFATYLGGSGIDTAAGVAVDSNGNIYVAGTTTSPNFPTTSNAFQTSATGAHSFVSKVSPQGTVFSLTYSTYLAGNGADSVTGLAIDSRGDAFVTGTTTSTDVSTGFPATTTGYQTSSLATKQFFASEINTSGSGATSMLYSTYFGGANPAGGTAAGGGVAVDTSGNMYITGTTNFVFDPAAANADPRTNFPILNAQQACLNQPPSVTSCTPDPSHTDAFLAKINPNRSNGSGLVYSTYLGGSLDDFGLAVAVDSSNNAYVTGQTFSSDWTPPTSPAPFQSTNKGAGDAFIAKIGNPTGTNTIFPLTYFTYLGGTGVDVGLGIAVDTAQAAHVTGSTTSGDLPITQGSLQGFGGVEDAFVGLISTSGAAGTYLTYLGGSNADRGIGIALDPNHDSSPTFVAGDTFSGNFPLSATPFQSSLKGPQDAFISVIGSTSNFSYLPPPTVDPTVSPSPATVGNQVTFTFTFVNNGPDPASNVIFSGTFPTSGVTFTSASSSPGGTCQNPVSGKITCTIGAVAAAAQATVTVVLTPTIGTTSLSVAPTLSANGGAFIPFGAGTVQVNDFTITSPPPSPASVTITAGQTASYVVTVTPLPDYSSSISMSQTGLPTASTATFTTQTITLSGSSPATTTLNIATTARPVNQGTLMRHGPLYATWLPIGGLSLLGFGVGFKRRRWLAGALLGLVAGIVLLQPACGGSSSSTPPAAGGTPAGTYVITITGSSGSVSHNAPVTLIVQ